MNAPEQRLTLLTTASTEFEGEAVASALRAEGIPVAVFSAAARTVQWEAGYQSGAQIHVRAGDVPAASEILRRLRRDRGRINWDEVDVGEGEDLGTLPKPGPRIGGLSPWLAMVRKVGVGSIVMLNLLAFVPREAIGGLALALVAAGVMIGLRSLSMRGRDKRATLAARR
ncbi:MAG: hypothetical protein ACOYN0_13630 [Phycisphaerales bacterium]